MPCTVRLEFQPWLHHCGFHPHNSLYATEWADDTAWLAVLVERVEEIRRLKSVSQTRQDRLRTGPGRLGRSEPKTPRGQRRAPTEQTPRSHHTLSPRSTAARMMYGVGWKVFGPSSHKNLEQHPTIFPADIMGGSAHHEFPPHFSPRLRAPSCRGLTGAGLPRRGVLCLGGG